MLQSTSDGIKRWLIGLFASAINNTSRAEDRAAAVQWLGQSRDVVASDLGKVEKLKALNALVSSRTAVIAIANSVASSFANYRTPNLPWAMKIALPATLAAIPLVGGQAAGIAAFGGAIGVPVLLLVFLGTAGITSIIETVVSNAEARSDIAEIVGRIVEDARLNHLTREMKSAMKDRPERPRRFDMPPEELALRAQLAVMDPFHFEQHIMSFFGSAGMQAWVTRKSNDCGVDGFARHGDGLMIAQCKRNAADNKVGRPTVQQFKGVIEENDALRGYIVTTSSFTEEAMQSASMSDRIVLVDIDALVQWHAAPPAFA